jgi:predicted O-linked N-acetylglucosamine transferase (SPINDLY family)
MLELIGVPELIARDRADYLDIGGRIVGDAAWRRELATRIRGGKGHLFDVPDAVESLQVLLQTGAPPT